MCNNCSYFYHIQSLTNIPLHSHYLIFYIYAGWNFDQTRFSYAASTPSTRSAFAQSVVNFLSAYDFDGIDLDWEYPVTRQGTPADYANYPLLCEALRAAFDAAGHPEWLITIATAINWDQRLEPGYDLVAMAPHVDWFNIMSYDIYGAWDSTAGANADMVYIQNTMDQIFALGIPREKLVFGLAAYGRSMKLTSPSCYTAGCPINGAGLTGCHGEAGTLPYFQIMETYVNTGNYDSLVLNPTSMSMELVTGGYQYFTSFDNDVTLKMKNDYAYDQCMRGIMWWAVDLIKTPIDFNMPTMSPTSSQEPSGEPSQAPSSNPTTSLAPSTSVKPSIKPTTSAPTKQFTPPPTNSPVNCGSGCPEGSENKILPILNCGGFYYCVGGQPSQVLMCNPGTLFDSTMSTCNWADQVTCACASPTQPPTPYPTPLPTQPPPVTNPPTSAPTKSPTAQPTTPPGSPTKTPTQPPTPPPTSTISNCESCPPTGWAFVSSSGCTGFYHCLEGELGSFQACPLGTLFDSSTMGCDYTHRVTCNCFGPVPPPTPPTPPPTPPGPVPATPPPTNPPTNSGGNLWYPDWVVNTRQHCLNDGIEPNWMASYTSTSPYTCCQNYYSWNYEACLGAAGVPYVPINN